MSRISLRPIKQSGMPGRIFLTVFILATLLAVSGSVSWARPIDLEPRQPQALVPNPAVLAMVNAVNAQTLNTLVGDLSGVNQPLVEGQPYRFTTRYNKAEIPIAKATQYVYEYFSKLDLEVEFQAWSVTNMGESGRNVIALQPGSKTSAPCIYIVTAHVDSIVDSGGDPMDVAPGADDDASGTAGVLMLAEILSRYSFGCTLRYVITTGEELGLLGSEHYVQSVAGDPIRGVFALDMIAYKTNAVLNFELISRVGAAGNPDRLLSTKMKDVLAAYTINLIAVEDQSNTADADHASFWGGNFPAILVIQDSADFNPNYHQTTDTLDKLNLDYFTKIVKVTAGALAHLAEPNYRVFLPMTRR